jgi:hypothetical protein
VADARQAWEQVVDGFGELGKVLAEKFAGAREEEPAEAPAAEAPEDGDSGRGADGRAVADALNALADAARRLGETAGAAVTDPALRESAVRVADRLGSALAATVEEMGEGLKTYADGRRNQRDQTSEGPWAQATDDEGPGESSTPQA